ncbi:hypothetical protein J3D54_005290 [Pseudomonas sp. GGS8]|uniref:hypothetical protein n=1 Tax=Pseudomonas sp. GGS8 TaxID=2817892 RepID=UPI00209E3477|nr:hypothetical protein [Pseudomonas sp. GGS8]MCP1446158.1 hypothetical protein [Pseudomonas sp. GGS8]
MLNELSASPTTVTGADQTGGVPGVRAGGGGFRSMSYREQYHEIDFLKFGFEIAARDFLGGYLIN